MGSGEVCLRLTTDVMGIGALTDLGKGRRCASGNYHGACMRRELGFSAHARRYLRSHTARKHIHTTVRSMHHNN